MMCAIVIVNLFLILWVLLEVRRLRKELEDTVLHILGRIKASEARK